MLKVNRIMLTGVVLFDPQVSKSGSGKDLLRFRLAFVQGEGEKRVTDHVQCLAIGYLATENAAMPKGAMVYLVGEFQISRWEKDGQPQVTPQILVSELRALDADRERLPINGKGA